MAASRPWLLCRVGTSSCALPLADVVEVMRPLPVVPVAGAPASVLGMCMMRGSAAPVVDAALCILGRPGEPTRFVAVRAGERRIALAVDAVLGTIELADDRASELPGLLSGASAAVAATAALDQNFLLLLQTGRVLPEFELASHAGNH